MTQNNALVERVTSVYDLLEKNKEQIASGIPQGTITPDRFVRIVMTLLKGDNKLLMAEKRSLIEAIMVAAQLGFEMGGPLGQCWPIPFKNNQTDRFEVQLMVGYQGWLDLCYRSNFIAGVDAVPVFADHGDEFEYKMGLVPDLVYIPKAKAKDRIGAKMTHVYAIITYLDPNIRPKFKVLTREDVEFYRNKSKAKNSPAWSNFYLAMAQKTAIHRVLKYERKSPQMRIADALEESQYGAPAPVLDINIDEMKDLPEDAQIPDETPTADKIADKITKEREEKKETETPKAEETPPIAETDDAPQDTEETVNTDTGEIDEPAVEPEPAKKRETKIDKYMTIENILKAKSPVSKLEKGNYDTIVGIVEKLGATDLTHDELDEMINTLVLMPDKAKRATGARKSEDKKGAK